MISQTFTLDTKRRVFTAAAVIATMQYLADGTFSANGSITAIGEETYLNSERVFGIDTKRRDFTA